MIEGNDILGLTTPFSLPSATPLSQALRDDSNKLNTTIGGTSHIYTAFRIAQLISSFRRKVKTRVLSQAVNKPFNTRIEEDVREKFEQEVSKVIANDRSRRRPAHRSERTTATVDRGQDPIGTEKTIEPCAERLLEELDSKLSQKGCLVSELASDNKLFLAGRYMFDYSNGVKKATELLALTEYLLGTLKSVLQHGLAQGKGICEGTEVLDPIFAANLEHILLCLHQDLLCFILIDQAWAKVLEHIFECQKEQSRRCETWFFEFPDARHPLSTTWPWSIRPCLAVLWGVCWMFYGFLDPAFNLRMPDTGEVLVPAEGRYIELFGWPQTGTNPLYATIPQPQWHESPVNLASPSTRPALGLETAASDQAAMTEDVVRPGATEHIIRTRYAPPSTQPRDTRQSVGEQHWPSVTANLNSATGAIFPVGDIATATASETRLGLQQPFSLQDQSDSSLTFLSPFCSPSSCGESPSHPSSHNEMPPFTPIQNITKSTTTSPSKALSTPERSKSPVAIDSPVKREGSTISPTNFQLPRPQIRGTPKTTENGKFACENCHQIFDRKCEWNKHMDKHERPYKCEKPQCAKLLGFTYSGGLLRHEREVHGMHGGPKEQLHCPIRHCKRHTEQGFTRRENLQEHLRRVHKLTDNNMMDALEDAPTPAASDASELSGTKRKRLSVVSHVDEVHDDDLRRELKRLKTELQLTREKQRDEISQIRRELHEKQQEEFSEIKRELRQMREMLEMRDMHSVRLPPVKLPQHERSQEVP